MNSQQISIKFRMTNENQNAAMRAGEHYCLVNRGQKRQNNKHKEKMPKTQRDAHFCPINRTPKVAKCHGTEGAPYQTPYQRSNGPPLHPNLGPLCNPTEYDGPYRIVPPPKTANLSKPNPPPEGCECCPGCPPTRPTMVIFDCCPVCPPPRPPPCVCGTSAFCLKPRPPICIRGSCPLTPVRCPRCPGPCPYGLCPTRDDKRYDRIENCCNPTCCNSCFTGWKNCLDDATCSRKYVREGHCGAKPKPEHAKSAGKHHQNGSSKRPAGGSSKPHKAAKKHHKSGSKHKKAKSKPSKGRSKHRKGKRK